LRPWIGTSPPAPLRSSRTDTSVSVVSADNSLRRHQAWIKLREITTISDYIMNVKSKLLSLCWRALWGDFDRS
jgi:hypothetical protein